MKYFCTLSDISYLPLGLTLYQSLLKTTSDDFVLYYLCLDDKSYEKLIEIKEPKIKPIDIKYLFKTCSDLSQYQQREYREFVWMLASYFTHYLIKTENIDHITYIDSDIYMYDDIQSFYNEVGSRSVGIIRHRHIPEDLNTIDGKYNVGIVHFKNNNVGNYCLNWWKDAVFHKKYPQLATCYDQKYLEGFLMMFSKDDICVADSSFAHGAPWHHRLYDWSGLDTDNSIVWEGKKQNFLFNHFSRIKFDVKANEYQPSGGQYADHTLNFTVFDIPQVKKIHDAYFEEIKNVSEKYSL